MMNDGEMHISERLELDSLLEWLFMAD